MPWPSASKIERRFGFLAQSGFDDSEGVAVVAYIAVEDLDAIEQRFSVSVDSMLQDPYFPLTPWSRIGSPRTADQIWHHR